jgi:uncharacterized protein YndB with AHSA1/START domain
MRPGAIHRSEARTDPRVGGAYEVIMHADSGRIVHAGVYRLIDRPRRLVFTWRSPHTGPDDSVVTVDFVKAGKSTEVIVTHEQLPEAALASHRNGWTGGLALLDKTCRQGHSL